MLRFLFLVLVVVFCPSFFVPNYTSIQRVEMIGRRIEHEFPCRARGENGQIQPCRFRYEIGGSGFNAWNKGPIIEVTEKMVAEGSDDEIAWILGHEFGHKNKAPNELGADVYGGHIAEKAGFDVCAGVTTLSRFGDGDQFHPPSNVRVQNFRNHFPQCK